MFDGLWNVGEKHQVWMSHGDRVETLAPGFEVVARSEGAPYAIATNEEAKRYSLMFHPEVVHTPDGGKLLANFVRHVCGCAGDWTMASFRDAKIADIREQVGEGPRDLRAVGRRRQRGRRGADPRGDRRAADLRVRRPRPDARRARRSRSSRCSATATTSRWSTLTRARDFLGGLEGVTDPEKKRKFIGAEFINVFEAEAKKIGGADFLAQGTLYPDVIESVSFTGGPSVTIKSHHNVGGLPERMNMKLVEPLRELFKDEVRELGRELGLPEAFVGRHPFPGPGLAIRIPGEVTEEKCDILRKADAIYLEEIRNAGLYDAIWQAFAVLLAGPHGRRDGRLSHLRLRLRPARRDLASMA